MRASPYNRCLPVCYLLRCPASAHVKGAASIDGIKADDGSGGDGVGLDGAPFLAGSGGVAAGHVKGEKAAGGPQGGDVDRMPTAWIAVLSVLLSRITPP